MRIPAFEDIIESNDQTEARREHLARATNSLKKLAASLGGPELAVQLAAELRPARLARLRLRRRLDGHVGRGEKRGLVAGRDPVAVDATGLRILEAKRRLHFGADEPFPVPPKHIRAAETKHALGVADPAKIDLVKLGWEEGVMV